MGIRVWDLSLGIAVVRMGGVGIVMIIVLRVMIVDRTLGVVCRRRLSHYFLLHESGVGYNEPELS